MSHLIYLYIGKTSILMRNLCLSRSLWPVAVSSPIWFSFYLLVRVCSWLLAWTSYSTDSHFCFPFSVVGFQSPFLFNLLDSCLVWLEYEDLDPLLFYLYLLWQVCLPLHKICSLCGPVSTEQLLFCPCSLSWDLHWRTKLLSIMNCPRALTTLWLSTFFLRVYIEMIL